jgi:sulfur transfer complex TusBCD TusB component (DsrH family)
MKTAKELKEVTKSREELLNESITKTVANFYVIMEDFANRGFSEVTDDLLSHATMAVKKEEYPVFVGGVIKEFEKLGYTVTLPFKDRKGVDNIFYRKK